MRFESQFSRMNCQMLLDRVQLRALGRQRHEGDVRRHDQETGEMPPGLVEDEHGVSPRRHLGRDLGEVQVHHLGVGWQDQGCALALFRADGGEDVG